ncbi:hypothetical protein HNP46_000323 [Pseudomonas nitritireducens]|uniref:Uncharacterized protein n=1 Tax=Pseudomonas nitroreducens TaxID=46680 RepID=A0A7W7KER4_PSENT|nr:hypothetical protein [Pseudomonas nitritireducens]MBB4861512.1 hypothetical protein [Pseudomonas nitritireducens]
MSTQEKKPTEFELNAKLFHRPSTNEWVLELSGEVNGNDLSVRHTAPEHIQPELVPSLLGQAREFGGPWPRELCESILASLESTQADPELIAQARHHLAHSLPRTEDSDRREFAAHVTGNKELPTQEVDQIIQARAEDWSLWRASGARWSPPLQHLGWLCSAPEDLCPNICFVDTEYAANRYRVFGSTITKIFGRSST